MKTICQVLHSLNVGGAEVLAARIARALGHQYRFVFACLDELGPLGESLRAEGLRVEVVGRRPGVDFECMRRLARYWRGEGVDVVQAHQYTPFFYALGARRWRRRPPILFTEHGRWFPDYPRPKRILFNRLMLRRWDRVVAVGESVRCALVSNEGIPARRIEVVYNGVEPLAFDGGGDDRAEARRELGIASEEFLIVQVARLDYLKDHGTAVRTMERMARVRPEARLVLVGEGPERAKIEEEIRSRGVGRQVLMLGLRQDVARLLSAADAFLLTSISEGIPVTVIEAMAARLPVVATNVGGLQEIVEHGRTGLLAAAGDDEAIADCLLRLAAAPAEREAMGAHARLRAEQVFSESRMHAGYRRCFEEMLNHGKVRIS